MVHEVVVVGGGIGGLTVAALLAARGVDVCLLERASQVGGVVAAVEKFGYTFDPAMGIYPCWEPGGIHDRVFSELPIDPPETRRDAPVYVVRLSDGIDVPVSGSDDEFFAVLRTTFSETAVEFYRQCSSFAETVAGKGQNDGTVADYLSNTPLLFQSFIDAQLQLLTQTASRTCSMMRGALALTTSRRNNFSIRGGAAALADSLAASFKTSGGRLRLNTPVLRLAFDSAGRVQGVTLLSGETVGASRAIISNLTLWDTFGKLIGLNRTPIEIRKTMASLKGLGAYLIYLGIDDSAAKRFPANRIIGSGGVAESDPEKVLVLAVAPQWNPRASAGRRAATVMTYTDVEEWFTFHESAEELETQDQAKLEEIWGRLHKLAPELGEGAEVIETSTPLDCYEQTRRKLGMVGRPSPFSQNITSDGTTPLDDVFIVGDTVSDGLGIAGVTQSAVKLADLIAKKPKK